MIHIIEFHECGIQNVWLLPPSTVCLKCSLLINFVADDLLSLLVSCIKALPMYSYMTADICLLDAYNLEDGVQLLFRA